jgi:DNA mismatch endonuclease, patch repair protein
MDHLTKNRRSENMRRIRAKNTRPELTVRQIAHRLGYRFRLHRKELPGKPDLVFPGLRKVIFVNGCFWHQHGGCREGRIPGSRREYWEPKLLRNQERDKGDLQALETLGWECLVLWECEVGDGDLASRIRAFLGDYRQRKASGKAEASSRRRYGISFSC